MYQRPSEENIQKWQREFANDRLYQNLFEALACVCRQIRLITPAEIWQMAKLYCSEIEQSENPMFAIDSLQDNIFLQMSNYSDDDANRISFLVRFVILYQLTRKQKNWENHPYEKFCKALIHQLEPNPLFNQLIPMVIEKNDRYEEVYGGELDVYDYLNETQEQPSTNKSEGTKDDHVKAFVEAMHKIATTKYSSCPPEMMIAQTYDWCAVYRLGKDIGLFRSFDEMQTIVKDENLNLMPKKQQNISKYNQYILDNYKYPNWQSAAEGEIYLRKFRVIADSIYSIYKLACKKRNIKPYEPIK